MPAQLQERLLTLVARAGEILGSPRVEEVLPGILQVARDAVAADGYAVWRLDDASGNWRVVGYQGVSAEFAAEPMSQRQQVESGDPIAAEDARAMPMLEARRAAYVREGIASILAIPLLINGRPDGTLVFYYRARHAFSPDEIEVARALGHIAAAALRTADLYGAQRYREEQALFLGRAAEALASSLDYHETLRTVARLAVPRIADWCAVDIVDAQGQLERVAIAHVDPTRIALAEAFARKYPPDPAASTGVYHVIRSGHAEMLERLTDDMIDRLGVDDARRRDIRELQITSYMMVPLRTRRGSAGAMTFVSAESGRHYTKADLQFAETVADRAAVAIENARAYDEVRQANHLKDEFLATLSHELRTPLNAILGYARMLRTGAVDGRERTDAALDVIERNASVLTQIVEDILDVSRIISGKLRLDMRPIDVRRLIADGCATVAPAAERKGVRLRTSVEDGELTLNGDEDRLRQVLWNLLTNALKFTPAGGAIDVGVASIEGGLEISVRDTGRGISSEFLPFIFERFRQADSRFTREQGGLGLGLSIASHIVEMHGGTIQAESDGEGRGATFRVRLPTGSPETGSPGDR